MAKVNYQYEKRQKELAKKRKKEQKQKLKELKKNNQTPGSEEAEIAQTPVQSSEAKQETSPVTQPENSG